MNLKKTFTRKINKEQLNALKGHVVIHSKELQEDGKYLIKYTTYMRGTYEGLVGQMVRRKYSLNEEFAILRKSINNPNNDEYLIYNAYVEDCKVKARAFVKERDSKLARYNELELEV